MNPTLLTSASSAVLNVLTVAGATLAQVQQVQAFVANAVQLAEQTGKDGATKLAAVLNATEAFVAAALPTLKADWNALAVEVKGFVNGLVSLWNALGVFVKQVSDVVNKAVSEVKSAVEPAPAGAILSGGTASAAHP